MNDVIKDCNMSFLDYIQHCHSDIKRARASTNHSATLEKIAAANSPFELDPRENKENKQAVGLLFIHGLLDSPFTMRDLADTCFQNSMLCRAVLLPGHGTTPKELMHVSHEDWMNTVTYGVETLKKDAEKIFLVGYSTGGTLAQQYALEHPHIAGIILIAPALKIKFPIDPLIHLLPYLNCSKKNTLWLKKAREIDYTKYRSVPYHAVSELSQLTRQLPSAEKLSCPLFVIVTQDDETISTTTAIDSFKANKHPKSQLLVYTTHPRTRDDERIKERNAYFPEQHIDNFSHRSLPFSPNNVHYGINGDYTKQSIAAQNKRYGAYISFLGNYYNVLHRLRLTPLIREELTYNPDFNFLSDALIHFIKRC